MRCTTYAKCTESSTAYGIIWSHHHNLEAHLGSTHNVGTHAPTPLPETATTVNIKSSKDASKLALTWFCDQQSKSEPSQRMQAARNAPSIRVRTKEATWEKHISAGEVSVRKQMPFGKQPEVKRNCNY